MTNLEGLWRFERSYLGRLTTYGQKVGDLVRARSADPGEWLENYTTFLGFVVADMGDWMLDQQSPFPEARDAIPFHRGVLPLHQWKLRRNEGATGFSVRVAPSAFEGIKSPDPRITLVTDLQPHGGGTRLTGHFEFVPPRVKRSNPRTKFRIYGVRDAVKPGDVYGGVVWAKETKRLAAFVEVKVE